MAQIAPNVGIDVSKEWLDVAVYPGGEHFRAVNDVGGWRELTRRLVDLRPRTIGIEASGGYERDVSIVLAANGLPVRSVNAWKLRQFAKAAGVLAKNDRLDARSLPGSWPLCPAGRFVIIRHAPTSSNWSQLAAKR